MAVVNNKTQGHTFPVSSTVVQKSIAHSFLKLSTGWKQSQAGLTFYSCLARASKSILANSILPSLSYCANRTVQYSLHYLLWVEKLVGDTRVIYARSQRKPQFVFGMLVRVLAVINSTATQNDSAFRIYTKHTREFTLRSL